MKKLAYVLLLAAVVVLSPQQVQANDYLEVQRHYQVYSNGRNSIHFKIPVWAYGRVNDYHLNSTFTTIRWQVKGQSVEPFMYVGGPAYGENRPYKIIENNHVVIIRNGEKYDVTGKKL